MMMDELQIQALIAWSEYSDEGLLVVDGADRVRWMNPRLREMFRLSYQPAAMEELYEQTQRAIPELRSIFEAQDIHTPQWGNLRVQVYPAHRLSWQRIPFEPVNATIDETSGGSLTIFQDASLEGQFDVARQSFLSVVSHDLRTPLSTILGYAELMYNNLGALSQDEQVEFLQHIIKNANELTRYTQIALDVMYLESNMQSFETQIVNLDSFIKRWLEDALHRFPAERVIYHNGTERSVLPPLAQIAPAALHKILYILVEFALAESDEGQAVDIRLICDAHNAQVMIEHVAPGLGAADASVLFRLVQPRDLAQAGRPPLHRMQLYVASLLAERQRGYLTLHGRQEQRYCLKLTLPLLNS